MVNRRRHDDVSALMIALICGHKRFSLVDNAFTGVLEVVGLLQRARVGR